MPRTIAMRAALLLHIQFFLEKEVRGSNSPLARSKVQTIVLRSASGGIHSLGVLGPRPLNVGKDKPDPLCKEV